MRIIGQLVLGPGEADKYLKYTLDSFKRLCDDVIVATCNAGRKEIKMLDKYDFRHYEDNREWGLHQPYIKTELLKKIHALGADWCLPLDADEEMDITRQELEELTKHREACYFYILNLWNDEQHYSRTLSFWNIRFYTDRWPLDELLQLFRSCPSLFTIVQQDRKYNRKQRKALFLQDVLIEKKNISKHP